MHARIESYTKHKEIFTQQKWCDSMKVACHKRPYEVKNVEQKDIFDFSGLSKQLMWNKVPIMKVREISIDPADSKLVYVRYDLRQKERSAPIFKKDIDIVEYLDIIKNYPIPNLYNSKVDVSDQKKEDFQTMINKRWIPPKYVKFYEDILK